MKQMEERVASQQAANEQIVFERTPTLTAAYTNYCPGCTHGLIHRLIAECIDELGLAKRTIGVAPVGCSVLAYNYFDLDFGEAAHGRAPAMATGIKRSRPDCIVFTYQGDGDLAAIGTAEIIHVALRGEGITTIFVNNAIYGMTGGQMAPTSLPGQRTTSSPQGRDVRLSGNPAKVCELLATIDGAAYIARVTVTSPAAVAKAKAAIKRAFKVQVAGLGFALVEVLSSCPTNWGLSPRDALAWVDEKMTPVFPLGEFKVGPGVAEL
jgi:2-oxoglutarate/2-oxoacid ferredoxin oxidoreductase subunit beta